MCTGACGLAGRGVAVWAGSMSDPEPVPLPPADPPPPHPDVTETVLAAGAATIELSVQPAP